MKLEELLPKDKYRWSEERGKGWQAWKVFTPNMRHVLNVELVDGKWHVSSREPLSTKIFNFTYYGPANSLITWDMVDSKQLKQVFRHALEGIR